MFQTADLWVLPPASQSSWFARVDWYLGWQMCKGMNYRLPTISSDLQILARDHKIPVPQIHVKAQRPLLIATRGLLPTNSLAVLPLNDDVKAWLAEAKKMATEMGAREVLVFLPTATETEKAEKIWLKADGECTAKFVADDD